MNGWAQLHKSHLKELSEMTYPESYELVYQEARRALENQERRLMELRGRAGTLVSAVTIATSFLGAELFSRDQVSTWGWVGLGWFAGSMLALILVLVPKRDRWVFESKAAALLKWTEASPPPEMRDFHRELSLRLEGYYEDNQEHIDHLYGVFVVACAFLVLEISFFTAALAGGR